MKNTWDTEKRIINVSNRLPVRINVMDGNISLQNSDGGLATGLGSVFHKYKNIWIGWPGAEIDGLRKAEVEELLKPDHLFPVFLSKKEIDNFYEGFSNEVIWPLFHYFTSYSVYDPEYWDAYVKVNQKFADEILLHATEDDIIWVQDYQLMLVPQMLRQDNPKLRIGYFHHIPFPSSDVLKALPWKEQIINGLLGADVIGFQTNNDVSHFRNVAVKMGGASIGTDKLTVNDRPVQVSCFPISIDYEKYKDLANSPETKRIAQKLQKQIDTKIMISIDRLDYSKGIIQRLQAFELFLKNYEEWRGKVTFIHLVVPSRENVGGYKQLKQEMNRLITDINGKYGTFDWQPIRHFYRSFPPNMLSAMYSTADLAVVTPIVDGMNLVSKEYIASNIHLNGALLLSEGAGAANELTESILVNPNDITSFAEKICYGLSMPTDQKQKALRTMQKKVERANIFMWANNFLDKLINVTAKKTSTKLVKIDSMLPSRIDTQFTLPGNGAFVAGL